MYSQKSYPKVKLGTCSDTISQSGCFLCSFCNLLHELGVGEIDPPTFNKKAYPNGGCMANAPYWAKMYGMTYTATLKPAKSVCIIETDHYAPKVPQHFCLWRPGNEIVDPLDLAPKWKKNPYHVVNYRIFTAPKLTQKAIETPKPIQTPTIPQTPVVDAPSAPQSVPTDGMTEYMEKPLPEVNKNPENVDITPQEVNKPQDSSLSTPEITPTNDLVSFVANLLKKLIDLYNKLIK